MIGMSPDSGDIKLERRGLPRVWCRNIGDPGQILDSVTLPTLSYLTLKAVLNRTRRIVNVTADFRFFIAGNEAHHNLRLWHV